jgi:hypothetical protein
MSLEWEAIMRPGTKGQIVNAIIENTPAMIESAQLAIEKILREAESKGYTIKAITLCRVKVNGQLNMAWSAGAEVKQILSALVPDR